MLFVPHRNETLLDVGNVPVYMQDWFTGITAHLDEARTFRVVENGMTVGNLSLHIGRNLIGMKQGHNLPWARLCGSVIVPYLADDRKTRIMRELIRQLPKDVSYFLTLASQADHEAFLAEGFEPLLEGNYVITPDRLSTLENSFSKMTKRHIRQAERDLLVGSASPDTFIKLYSEHLARRRRKPYVPLGIAQALIEEGLHRDQCRIFTAQRRDTGEIDAAIACLWDSETYYYWMTTRRLQIDGESRPQQGAVKLLIWSAIQDAALRGLTFDFDGIGIESTAGADSKARLYEGMGAELTVRYGVSRTTPLERGIQYIRGPAKQIVRRTVGRFMALKLNH